MRVYLAGNGCWYKEAYSQCLELSRVRSLCVLDSYVYLKPQTEELVSKYTHFLLDSGVFTFLNQGNRPNFNEYIKSYAAMVNRVEPEEFIEADLYNVVGIEKTIELRRRLESMTGRKCVPVWHKILGKRGLYEMCEQYSRIAIGGFAIGDIKRSEYRYFPAIVKDLRRNGVSVHGLGFTNMEWLKKIPFNSVDSSAWTCGNRFGFAYEFKNGELVKHKRPNGKKIASPMNLAVHNCVQFAMFANWAEDNL